MNHAQRRKAEILAARRKPRAPAPFYKRRTTPIRIPKSDADTLRFIAGHLRFAMPNFAAELERIADVAQPCDESNGGSSGQ